MDAAAPPRGIRASLKRVVGHAAAVTRLQKELAATELKQKAGKLGAGAGLLGASAVVGFYVVGFGLAAATAALALLVDVWLALLIMFGVSLLLMLVLVLVGVRLVKKATPLAPTQALEEARLTSKVLKGRGD